jgi:hypothetical protein
MANAQTVGVWNGPRREMEEEGWKLVRTLRGGTKAMREAGEYYTPRTSRERKEPMRYQDRLRRSVLFPMYDTQVRYIASLPFQKAPTVIGNLPEPLDRILGDADRMGTSLANFMRKIYEDAIDRGVGLFLVDNVPVEGLPLTVVDEMDARPYFCRIAPDNLVGFRTATKHGREVVVELRYREWLYRPSGMGFDTLVDRVVVWTEDEVQTWEHQTAKRDIDREMESAQEFGTGYQLIESRPHGYEGIPLVTVYTEQVSTLHGKPAMLDLAYINVAHWNSSSIQGEALHYSRSPILKMTGISRELAERKPEVGPGSHVIDTADTADIGFIEIAGTSLTAGREEIGALQAQMDALGLRPLLSVGGPQTATGEVRADLAEKSQAQAWVQGLEWAIYQAFQKAAKWLGMVLPEDFDIQLFKDSSLIAGRAQDLPVLQQMAQLGLLTKATLLAEFKARGVLVTVEDVAEEVEAMAVEAEQAVERQMAAMADRMISDRQPPQDPNDPPADQAEDAAQ